MKKIWALRHIAVLFGSLLLICWSFAWVVSLFPLYAGVGLALLALLVIVNIPFSRRRRAHILATVKAALLRSYQPAAKIPALEMSYSYGYPAFTVTFASKAERDAASEFNDAFKREIASIFNGTGPRSRPFNADQAVFFTYMGYTEELRAFYASRRVAKQRL